MYKLSNGSQFFMVFLITIGLLASASGQVQKCAGISEYCQNHWDCCSNSCMSYLYKCVRNYNIYPYTFLSYEPPRRTIEEILELNFGVNSYVRPNAAPLPIGVNERFLSTNEVTPNNQVVELVDLQPLLVTPITTQAAVKETLATATPAFQTVSRLAAVNEIVPKTTATNASPSTPQSPLTTPTAPAAVAATASTITSSSSTITPLSKCSEIGVKCYRNEECCTQRCHGFLHQCVT